jgi:Tfp pilus assembly protein PilN
MFHKNLKDYIKKNNIYLCILVEETALSLCLYKKTNQIFNVIQNEKKSFQDPIILNGIVCNPSKIVLFINKFLQQHTVSKSCELVVYIPPLAKSTYNPINILQLSLCISKTPLILTAIYSTPHNHELCFPVNKKKHNHLTIFQKSYNQKSLFAWVMISGICIATILFVLIRHYNQQKTLNLKLQQKQTELTQELAVLQETTKQQTLLQKNAYKKQQSQKLIKMIQGNNKCYSQLCKIISETIPPDVYLKTLNIKKKQNNEKAIQISLRGKTENLSSLHTFKQTFSKNPLIKTLTITSVEKNEQKNKYIFKLKGLTEQKLPQQFSTDMTSSSNCVVVHSSKSSVWVNPRSGNLWEFAP